MRTTLRYLLVALIVTILSAPLAAAVPPASDRTGGSGGLGALGFASCGGSGPGTCSNGAHAYAFSLTHSCLPGAGYTGTITSILSYDGGAREFSCVYQNGAFVASNGQGTFPPPGVTFTQTCAAAGVGNWGCSISWT